MDLKLFFSVFLGKIIFWINRLLGSGGTAAPGLAALKIEPLLVKKLTVQLEKNIVITGTNGKTTTARMLSSILTAAGIKHLHNRAGSNLQRGIASTLIKEADIFGRIEKGKWGLWEADEAAFPAICRETEPEFVLINNLFRDQLDRYGEIDAVYKKWRLALKKLPASSQIILNSDDAFVANLAKNLPQKLIYFGLSCKDLKNQLPNYSTDATNCPRCFKRLKFNDCFAGHLGNYSCPKCGQIQPLKDYYLIKSQKGKNAIKTPKEIISFFNFFPGVYNLYNFTAAAALADIIGIKAEIISQSLSDFKPAFGRVEKIILPDKKNLFIFLVKNPTGFNEVINTLISKKRQISCLIAINDLIADGTDVSWLWDVNFEKLKPYLKLAIISGTRAYDMALRLKYAQENLTADKQKLKLLTEPKLKKAIKILLNQPEKEVYILPTYTAMLEVRKILNKMGLVHSSWKD